jgi:hypothetical protein
MGISTDTIRKDIWNTIYTYLNKNIVDPNSRSKKWIYGAMPKVDDRFSGFPILIMPSASIEKTTGTFDKDKDKSFELTITAYATKSEDVDKALDAVDAVLSDINVIDKRFTLLDVTQTDIASAMLDNQRIHYSSLVYSVEIDI